MKSKTAENVLLVAIGVPLILTGFLVAALVERRERPQAQVTIMKVRPIPIGTHAKQLVADHPPGSPRFSHLNGE